MSAPLLFVVSGIWLYVAAKAGIDLDWKNLLVYGGIFLTNTGLAFHALH